MGAALPFMLIVHWLPCLASMAARCMMLVWLVAVVPFRVGRHGNWRMRRRRPCPANRLLCWQVLVQD